MRVHRATAQDQLFRHLERAREKLSAAEIDQRDAENDHAFLCLCECSAAVANALPGVKEHADLVLRGDHVS